MANSDGFLHNAYRVTDPDKARDFYDDWASTYDAEVEKNGYITPKRCAEALAQLAPDLGAPLLDMGCGTGLSGAALKTAGFTNIHGSDLSPEMLKLAEARGIYDKLWLADLETPFPFTPGTFAMISAMGVLVIGHAPPSTIDDVLGVLAPGGLFVFSLNDHTLEEPEYESRLVENIDTGNARLVYKDYGDHLPGISMNSIVYILEKT